MLYSDFLNRIEESKRDAKLYKITPAVAIHSPYSGPSSSFKKGFGVYKRE